MWAPVVLFALIIVFMLLWMFSDTGLRVALGAILLVALVSQFL